MTYGNIKSFGGFARKLFRKFPKIKKHWLFKNKHKRLLIEPLQVPFT